MHLKEYNRMISENSLLFVCLFDPVSFFFTVCINNLFSLVSVQLSLLQFPRENIKKILTIKGFGINHCTAIIFFLFFNFKFRFIPTTQYSRKKRKKKKFILIIKTPLITYEFFFFLNFISTTYLIINSTPQF